MRAGEFSFVAGVGTAPRAGAYLSTLGLTLTNPVTIPSFAAIFSGIGFVTGAMGVPSATILVTGVFAGFTLWWVTLIYITSMLRDRLTPMRLTLVNRFSGLAILAFGAIALLSVDR